MAVEIPARGKRGAKLPPLPKWIKPAALWLFERQMKAKGAPLGYLTTIGAKSGVERRVPLRVFVEGDAQWLVVASLGGSAGNPAWLHNLRAHPDRVTFEVDGSTHKVSARTLGPEERAVAWTRIVRDAPNFGDYEKSTDRVIPVIQLTRTDT
ncbi:hypothetical protein JNB_00470 [Janibacter sp. HTCC2649]|uniref:nitroreductase/quinone reductase family protein n=1 Tax=Janibacter sp. HTCC2649 TaxID=313589 RepID=UPI000066EB6D|nr:nitroreductase/quinone reductase family protein [Janibacter sp. HTCC2649]EAP98596.1 hypothetical protein JNB_00470 [Janibacter sp. HTCC2649]